VVQSLRVTNQSNVPILMRKLIYISLLAIAGCTTPLTAPQQLPPTGISASDLSSYFWHDSTSYHYQSSVSGHSLSVQAGVTTIVDKNQSTNINTTFMVTNANGAYSMSGFSHNDLFAFDSLLQIVSDTASPAPMIETIRSIASITPLFGGQAKLYAASDSVLYEVDLGPNPVLKRLVSIPSGYTLSEDAQDLFLFAYQFEGNSIMWTSDNGSHWTSITTPSKITAFTSGAAGNFFNETCWFACGQDVYKVSGGTTIAHVNSLPSTVVTLASENGAVIAGLNNNALYLVPDGGSATLVQTLSNTLQGIAFVPSIFTNNPVLAGTSNGVYSVSASGQIVNIGSGSVSAIYSTGSSIFAAVNSGILHFYPSGTLYDSYLNPPTGIVTQFARPIGLPDSTQGVYVLSGTTIFRRDSDAAGSRWTQVNQVISPQWHPQPGALTLLTSDTNWLAGYIVNTAGLPRSYAYRASGSGPYAQVTLDNVSHNNVFMVRYTAYSSNGVADVTDIPEYLIYFQQGTGPIRIERTENSNTTITRLVP
jgi:hypothetical protein